MTLMALGPQKQNKEALLKQVEAIIDKHVKSSDGDRVIIATSLLPDRFSAADWPTLKKRYKEAGWKRAEYVSDQRDGDFIDLES